MVAQLDVLDVGLVLELVLHVSLVAVGLHHDDLVVEGDDDLLTCLAHDHVVGLLLEVVLVQLLQSLQIPHAEQPFG